MSLSAERSFLPSDGIKSVQFKDFNIGHEIGVKIKHGVRDVATYLDAVKQERDADIAARRKELAENAAKEKEGRMRAAEKRRANAESQKVSAKVTKQANAEQKAGIGGQGRPITTSAPEAKPVRDRSIKPSSHPQDPNATIIPTAPGSRRVGARFVDRPQPIGMETSGGNAPAGPEKVSATPKPETPVQAPTPAKRKRGAKPKGNTNLDFKQP